MSGLFSFAAFAFFVGVIIYEVQQNLGGSSTIGSAIANVEATVTGKLTATQIASYASAAGFSGNDLVTAVAVALAESGGNPQAHNPEVAANTPNGQGSYGLWQIYLKAHPEFAGLNLYDPQTNANAAFSVFSARGSFQPWSTFGSGAYEAHLATAQEAVNA